MFLTFQELGRDGAVPLSNSLSLADRHRIRQLIHKNRGKTNQEFCPFKYGKCWVHVDQIQVYSVQYKVYLYFYGDTISISSIFQYMAFS